MPRTHESDTRVEVVTADGSTVILTTYIVGTELHVYLHRPGNIGYGLGQCLTGYVGQTKQAKFERTLSEIR